MQKYRNTNSMRIPYFQVVDITSPIDIMGVEGGIVNLEVGVNLMHSRASDIEILLVGPNGREIQLVGHQGGNRNNFIDTVFAENSKSSIVGAEPPFTGRFAPQESMTPYIGMSPNGQWLLKVKDERLWGGGCLNSWELRIVTDAETETTLLPGNREIKLKFVRDIEDEIAQTFFQVVEDWKRVLNVDWVTEVDKMGPATLIEIDIKPIDGRGRVLGQAGPTRLGSDRLPSHGMMQFDVADVAHMLRDGSLYSVIKHEMAHVLGFGTLWQMKGLVNRVGSADPVYVGEKAVHMYLDLSSSSEMVPIPVANTGGNGTRDAHWREATFANELMSGFLNAGNNPMSIMTVAAFQDLGYKVDYSKADDYSLPGMAERLDMLGVLAANVKPVYARAIDIPEGQWRNI